MRWLAIASLLVAVTAFADDSPLVKAAKNANRGKPKSRIVITNDNLMTSGGHLTTSATAAPIEIPKKKPQANESETKAPEGQKAEAQKPAPPLAPTAQIRPSPLPQRVDVPDPNTTTPGTVNVVIPPGMASDPQTAQNTRPPL